MAELRDDEIDAALARGARAKTSEPRAAFARYDATSKRIIVDLTNDCMFVFPLSLSQGLENATEVELTNVEILGAGYGLHWPALDVDVSVPALLNGVFGTAAYMAQRAGRTVSPAKAAAARANGTKGGRPRKALAR